MEEIEKKLQEVQDNYKLYGVRSQGTGARVRSRLWLVARAYDHFMTRTSEPFRVYVTSLGGTIRLSNYEAFREFSDALLDFSRDPQPILRRYLETAQPEPHPVHPRKRPRGLSRGKNPFHPR